MTCEKHCEGCIRARMIELRAEQSLKLEDKICESKPTFELSFAWWPVRDPQTGARYWMCFVKKEYRLKVQYAQWTNWPILIYKLFAVHRGSVRKFKDWRKGL
jgi:hypothetical protein